MKRVSFEVAKALKDAGYPQGQEDYAYRTNGEIYVFENMFDHISDYCCDAPFVMDAWLWLWREKGIKIEIIDGCAGLMSQIVIPSLPRFYNDDPEEVIKKAIEYLVDNNLIK